MIGPVSTPLLPQTLRSVAEPLQVAPAPVPAEDPRAGQGVETPRAVRPIPEDLGQRGIEGAIAATENTIRMTEEVARRDRDRLERYPVEIETLRSQVAASTEPDQRAALTERVSLVETALSAATTRLADYEATWPDRRAALEAQVVSYKTQLAKAAYGQM